MLCLGRANSIVLCVDPTGTTYLATSGHGGDTPALGGGSGTNDARVGWNGLGWYWALRWAGFASPICERHEGLAYNVEV